MKSTQKIYILTMLAVVAVAALWAAPLMAQTKTARGVAASYSQISGVVPEVGNLESQVNETTTLMESIESCAQDNRFYDPNTGNCRTSDPVDVQFTSSPTQLSIQRPDGSTAVYNLDGPDGSATVTTGPSVSNCTAPWGGVVLHGASVDAYLTATVAEPATCTVQTRTCDNGTLSGSYTNQNCAVGGAVPPPADCSLPWGGTIAHGASVRAYRFSVQPFGGTCQNEMRACTNGILSGTYTNQACSIVGAPPPTTTCRRWNFQFDGWCKSFLGKEVPQCNNFNLQKEACGTNLNCRLTNVEYKINTCAVCDLTAERCITE